MRSEQQQCSQKNVKYIGKMFLAKRLGKRCWKITKVIGGYDQSGAQKNAALKEVTVTTDEDENKTYLDVKVKDEGELSNEELDLQVIDQTELLNEILKELRITNKHLMILTDNHIDKEDII